MKKNVDRPGNYKNVKINRRDKTRCQRIFKAHYQERLMVKNRRLNDGLKFPLRTPGASSRRQDIVS